MQHKVGIQSNNKAWLTDSDSGNLNDRNLDEYPPIGIAPITLRDARRVLVGPPGSGKTLFLTNLSKSLRKQSKEDVMIFHPRNESGSQERFVERLTLSAEWETLEAVNRLLTVENWAKLWTIALITVGLRLAMQPEDIKKVTKLFQWKLMDIDIDENPTPFAVGTHVEKLLKLDWDQVIEVSSTLRDNETKLYSALEADKKRLLIFIDNPDEFLFASHGHKVTGSHQSNTDGVNIGSMYPVAWQGAQLGLVRAIHQIRKSNPRLIIFASIRSEAWDIRLHDELGKCKEICQFLHYDYDNLLEIFRQNVQLSPDEKLAAKVDKAKSPVAAFFGRECYEHPQKYLVTPSAHSDGLRYEEPIFDAIIRHTLWTPRQLMDLCGELMDKYTVEQRASTEASELVNKLAAKKIFQEFTARCFPKWNDKYVQILNSIQHNILEKDFIDKADEEFSRSNPDAVPPFVFFYYNGLIGRIVKQQTTGKFRQEFIVNVDCCITKELALPASEFNKYLVHPVLDAHLQEKHSGQHINYVSNEHLVIGHGNSYESERNPSLFVIAEDSASPSPQPRIFCKETELGLKVNQLPKKNNPFKALLLILMASAHSGRSTLNKNDINAVAKLIDERLGWKGYWNSKSVLVDVFDQNIWRDVRANLRALDKAFVPHSPTETKKQIVSISRRSDEISLDGFGYQDILLSPKVIACLKTS